MRQNETKDTIQLHYDNWTDMLDHTEKPHVNCTCGCNWSGDTEQGASRGDGNLQMYWHGEIGDIRTFEQAASLARSGWKDGLEKARILSEGLFNEISHYIQKPNFVDDMTGISFDTAKVIAGIPDAWLDIQETFVENTGTKHIRLVYNISASSGISGASMIARGSMATALVELLEFAGNRVELILADACVNGSSGKNKKYDLFCTLKRLDQDTDLSRIVFAFAHPAMLRCICFSCVEHLPEAWRDQLGIPGGYSTPCDIPESERGDIYFGKMLFGDPDWNNLDICKKFILAELQKQGVELKLTA
jgi:hypothetical protein